MGLSARFAVRLPVAGPLAGPQAITEIASLSEDLGFDQVSVHDFIAWSRFQDRTHISCGSLEAVEDAGFPDPLFYESLTTIAYVAAVTKRVRLLISVLVLPYRNPVVAAKQLATLDVLSKGRLVLGVGVGAARSTHNTDFELLNVSRKDKYERTLDYFRAMHALWTSDPAEYEGRFVSFPPTEFFPKPIQRPTPPIWVGGGGPKSVELAATFGTGWIPPWIDPLGYRERLDALYELAAAKGRGDVVFDIATTAHACIDETDLAARKHAQRTADVLTEGFAADATSQTIAASGLVGSPETIANLLGQYIDSGVTHFELRFIYRTLEHLRDQLQLFSEEVFPRVSHLAAGA